MSDTLRDITVVPRDETTRWYVAEKPSVVHPDHFKVALGRFAEMKQWGHIDDFDAISDRIIEVKVMMPYLWEHRENDILEAFILGVTGIDSVVNVRDLGEDRIRHSARVTVDDKEQRHYAPTQLVA